MLFSTIQKDYSLIEVFGVPVQYVFPCSKVARHFKLLVGHTKLKGGKEKGIKKKREKTIGKKKE